MPVWSKEDINICRREFYDRTVSQELVDELFERWGGIPRYVLEKANKGTDQKELDIAIDKCTTHDIMTYTGSEGAPEHISHKLLHMIIERDPPPRADGQPHLSLGRYSTFQIDVASEYIAKRLTDKFGPDVRHHLQLLQTLQSHSGAGVLFGHLYENFAHRVLPQGGDFPIRNLTTEDVSTLHLEPKTTKQLQNVHSLTTIKQNEYGEGHNTFHAVDAVVSDPPNLFNMTASSNQQWGLNGDALRTVFDNLPTDTFPRPCHYNWVVPSNKFGNFEKQKVSGFRSEELNLMMTQFVFELSISEPSKQQMKRKERTDEVGESSGGDACDEILKSGPRKGKTCGRKNCPHHKNKKRKS